VSERSRTAAQLLGHPPDARLLIINADDFGMCHAENIATIQGLAQGAFCSATVMVPCPWFEEVVAFARRAPTADLGVHITHTSEWATYKWGPVSDAVPSMVDAAGYFYSETEAVYARAQLDDVARETRAQIERALAAGIDVTHLDSHMGTMQLDLRYHSLYVQLAAEYRLPIRMVSRTALRGMGMESVIDLADRLGVMAPDHFWYGGPAAVDETPAYWEQMLRNLKPGVTELYIHAAVDAPEMRAISDAWTQRDADFRFFTAPATRALLRDLGIQPVGYRALRDLQRRTQSC